ncbi:AroM family protein [Lysinibacillus sphaericus]|uniref:AroM family protein n=1 Tax=Lysinibacillus sphaericus TaxID=1421 RepID=UPI00055CFBC5|nr:AroM family protein [Lysinibacillus sphaericus]QTB21705.1 AroM family protein [Lysinibacillus sphaericus]
MENSKIAIVTIGQAPRKDMAEDIQQLRHGGLHVHEFGVLDSLSPSEIAALSPSQEETDVLVTLLANSQQVRLSKAKLMPYIQQCLHDLQDFTWILLMCTGDFANKLSVKNLLLPDRMMTNLVKGLHTELAIGLIGPEPEQQITVAEKWQKAHFDVNYSASSPYRFNAHDLLAKAQQLESDGADLLILDCMGYSTPMKNMIKHQLNIPIIVPREAVFTILKAIC